MMTATEARLKEEAQLKSQLYERMIEEFLLKWAPEDRYQSAKFNAELVCIIRQLFIDVQGPMQDAYFNAAMVKPQAPIIIKGK